MRTSLLVVILTTFIMLCLGAPTQAQEDKVKLVHNDPHHSARLTENFLFDVSVSGRSMQVNSLFDEDETGDYGEATVRVAYRFFKTKWIHPYLTFQATGSTQSTDFTGTNDLDVFFDQRTASLMGGIRLRSDIVYLWSNGPQVSYDFIFMAGATYRKHLEEEILISAQLDGYASIRLTNRTMSFYVRTWNRISWETSGQLAELNSISSIGVGFTSTTLGKLEIGVGGGDVSHRDLDSGGTRVNNGDRPEAFLEMPWLGGVVTYSSGDLPIVGPLTFWGGGGYSDWVTGDDDTKVVRKTQKTSGFLFVYGLRKEF